MILNYHEQIGKVFVDETLIIFVDVHFFGCVRPITSVDRQLFLLNRKQKPSFCELVSINIKRIFVWHISLRKQHSAEIEGNQQDLCSRLFREIRFG